MASDEVQVDTHQLRHVASTGAKIWVQCADTSYRSAEETQLERGSFSEIDACLRFGEKYSMARLTYTERLRSLVDEIEGVRESLHLSAETMDQIDQDNQHKYNSIRTN